MSDDIIARLKEPFDQAAVRWRVQSITRDGSKALALAYIDARDAMDRLDMVVGAANWQNEYYQVNSTVICRVGILISGQWVWKSDGAGETQVEAEKGALSDAFKRACVRWGIGRYLYDIGDVWVPCETADRNGKKAFSKFKDDPWNYVRNRPPNHQKPQGQAPGQGKPPAQNPGAGQNANQKPPAQGQGSGQNRPPVQGQRSNPQNPRSVSEAQKAIWSKLLAEVGNDPEKAAIRLSELAEGVCRVGDLTEQATRDVWRKLYRPKEQGK